MRSLLYFPVLISSAVAHTWIDYLISIDNGQFVGTMGYPRAYVGRTDPGFNGFSNNWLLPEPQSGRLRIDKSDFLCHTSQRTPTQSAQYPRLKAAPGTYVAMKYAENGHVSLPNNQIGKPAKGGTVFVYGTTSPKNDEKLIDVLKWTEDGKGGDKRGILINAQNYDDGRCYEINGKEISQQRQKEFPNPVPGQPTSRMPMYCESDVRIPTDASTGKPYTLYWVWQWPTEPNKDPNVKLGKDEYYASCMDLDIVKGTRSANVAQAEAVEFIAAAEANTKRPMPDPHPSAVTNYQSRTALATQVMPLPPTGVVTSSAAPTSTAVPTATTSPGRSADTSAPTRTRSSSGSVPTGVDRIPTFAPRPTGRPLRIPAGGNGSNSSASTPQGGKGNLTTVTVIERVTVTARDSIPAATTAALKRDSAKFRARYISS